VARVGGVTALAACALAIALAGAEGLAGGQAEAPSIRPIRPAQSDLYPSLRTVRELGGPGGATTDAGVGVYPALSEPQALSFPRPVAIEAARAYAAKRRGRVSFAVADARGGIAGRGLGRRYQSASLVKAMILVAYLDQVDRTARELSKDDRARLAAMIRVSDNDSASTTFRRLRPWALDRVARRAGLRSFAVFPADWGSTRVTAADQARFFLSLDTIPSSPDRRRYARHLLSSIASAHSWGIPRAARPRWRVFFKGGWRKGRSGELVHQAALLERGSRRVAIAVLTDGNPSQRYGEKTVRGIAERLLRGRRPADRVRSGTLSPITSLIGFRAPRPRGLRRLAAARR
jgi:Beta-lactamase enzyme family